MKRLIRVALGIFILTTCLVTVTWAQSATKEEAITKCQEAAKLVQEKGLDVASQIIGDKTGPFVWKDAYVFLMDLDGKMIAHPIKPEMTQQDNVLKVADTNGKPVTVEFIKVAGGAGQGWVDYMWPKPGQDKPAAKSTYIYRVPGTPYLVGAGIYK